MTLNASYATQSDYADSPISYRTDYWFVEATLPVSEVNVLLVYEVLGSGWTVVIRKMGSGRLIAILLRTMRD